VLSNSRAAPIPNPAGPKAEIIIIKCHGLTIGSGTKACKRRNTRIAV
jgi:hypothetical protein